MTFHLVLNCFFFLFHVWLNNNDTYDNVSVNLSPYVNHGMK